MQNAGPHLKPNPNKEYSSLLHSTLCFIHKFILKILYSTLLWTELYSSLTLLYSNMLLYYILLYKGSRRKLQNRDAEGPTPRCRSRRHRAWTRGKRYAVQTPTARCVCTYAFMYMYMYMYMYTYIYLHRYVYTYLFMCRYTYAYTYIYI